MELKEILLRGEAFIIRKQQQIIRLENSPDRTKKLRAFSSAEACAWLGITEGHLRNLRTRDGFPRGQRIAGNRVTFSFEDIQRAREWLLETTQNLKYAPRRRASRGERVAVLGVVNFKGGVAKTTSAVHLSQHLALAGYRVLLIDLDVQGSATSLFGIEPSFEDDPVRSFATWVQRETDDAAVAQRCIRPTHWPTIDLVTAGPSLHAAEIALQNPAFGGDVDAPTYRSPRHELIKFVDAVGDSYDVIVVDTRPDMNQLAHNTLHVANGLVVPIYPSMADVASSAAFVGFLARTLQLIEDLDGRDAVRLQWIRMLPTRVRPVDQSHARELEFLRMAFPTLVMNSEMVDTTVLGRAGDLKETLYEYEPDENRGAYHRALESLTRVNQEIEAEIRRGWSLQSSASAANAPTPSQGAATVA
jgi:chromosome partitioning protein